MIGFLIAVGAVAVLFAMTSAITVPVIVAIAMAVVFAPVVDWLVGHGLNRSLAAIAVLVGLLAIVVLVVGITSAALVDEADVLSENLNAAVDDIKGWLADTPISGDLADQTSETTTAAGPTLASGLAGGAIALLGGAAALVSGIVLGVIALYYFLKSARPGRRPAPTRRTSGRRRGTASPTMP